MKKTIGLLLAAMMLTLILPVALPAAQADGDGIQTVSEAEGQKGTIVNCKAQVNVRAKASTSAKVLGKAKKGETFKVLGTSGNWVRIDFNGKDGYVYKTYIKVEGTPAETPLTGKVGKIVNCKKQINVREQATSLSKLVGVAKKGETYKVLATAGSWVKIEYNGKTGYVFKTYIRVTEPEESIEGKTGTIDCKTQVNVRAKATKDSKLLGKAKKGETFTVLGKSGNWIKIDFSGKTGYVYKRYVKIG